MLHAHVDAPRVAVHAAPPTAVFTARSYAPGDRAQLVVRHVDGKAQLQILEVGGDPLVRGVGGLYAKLVLPSTPLSSTIVIGDWPSGVYAARVSDRGRVTYALFVLRVAHAGANRVAVVVPTNTWAAYNFADGNGDGVPDTWYRSQAATVACMNARGAARGCTVSLATPMDKDGLGGHFRSSVVGFMRWMSMAGHQADMLSEDDLEHISSGDVLASRYKLIVYPWHSEYVTAHEYALIERYRDLGGHLAFLSADNFYRRVDRHGDDLTLIDTWRDLGRPEATLVGEEYLDSVPEPLSQPAIPRHRTGEGPVALRRHRPARRLPLRGLRHRDRRHDEGVASRSPRARPHSGHLRSGVRRHDVLHDGERSTRVRRRHHELRRIGDVAAYAHPARQPVDDPHVVLIAPGAPDALC